MTRSLTRAIGVFVVGVTTLLSPVARGAAGPGATEQPLEVLRAALDQWKRIVQPAPGEAPRTFVTRIKVVKADGLPKALSQLTADVAYQAPDRLRVSVSAGGRQFQLGRDGQELWVNVPDKRFALLGRSGVPRFQSHPDALDRTQLPPFQTPLEPVAIALALSLSGDVRLEMPADGDPGTKVLHLSRKGGPDAEGRVLLRAADLMPLWLSVRDGTKADVEIELVNPRFEEPWPAEKWALTPADGTKVETVALAHLARFIDVAPDVLINNHIPTLPPATGDKRVVAREGAGRLEMHDGTRVLFLKGSPAEMGRQHGKLLRKEILHTMDRIIYGIGVGSSFDKGDWFFGEIESAQRRVEPYCDPRYLEEMDAIAAAVGAHPQEARLANFFPELFHCSGFSIFGKATKDGRMYHGRILDYMKGIGLEQNAVVIVHQPDAGRHAWVNVSYAGFVGSVTAMNDKHISIGEMGGGGYGKWDGKPMAQLVRDVMENADSLDEAVAIMRKGPRTCEYYYVISDGKTNDAVGIAATPDTFEVIKPGQSHPRLPHPVADAVLLSAGDRYEELARRVKDGFGTFDAESAIGLMSRPVCMTSNIHSALFAPDTLELWVANADSENVASHTRFTRYDLKELLKPEGTAEAR
jgi:isopenicillin-N N-acyltransferase-like protein